jgi:hypothetical protein
MKQKTKSESISCDMVIGIDPGNKTGIAIFKAKKLAEVKTLTPYQTVIFFQENYSKIKRAVIEYSKGQSHIFQSAKTRANSSAFGAIGRRIGQVDGLCQLYIECLESNKILVNKITPFSKGHKYSSAEFKSYFPEFKGRTNEHERDAIKIVYKFNFHLDS